MDVREIIATTAAAHLLAGDDAYTRDNGNGYIFVDGNVQVNGLALAILAALKEAGYAVVPTEPTDKMMKAAYDEIGDRWAALNAYGEMLRAAAQEQEKEDDAKESNRRFAGLLSG